MEQISYLSQFVNIKMRHNIEKKTMISKLRAERILDVITTTELKYELSLCTQMAEDLKMAKNF